MWDLSYHDQGSNPHPLHWKHRVLTPGLPGKSHLALFLSPIPCTIQADENPISLKTQESQEYLLPHSPSRFVPSHSSRFPSPPFSPEPVSCPKYPFSPANQPLPFITQTCWQSELHSMTPGSHFQSDTCRLRFPSQKTNLRDVGFTLPASV